MLLFLISFLSFILLSKSLVSWANEMRLLSHWYLRGLSCFLISLMMKRKLVVNLSDIFPTISFKKMSVTSCKVENVKESEEMSVLDLPELALECILGMLPPSALSNMASVCRSLKDRCRSDHLWERHLKEKWGRVIDHAAYREWQWQIASRRRDSTLYQTKPKGLIRSLSSIWPLLCVRSNRENSTKLKTCLPVNSVMSLYLSLETGKFWFPAQVYNREHGHAGFMLSCYDAELCYDRRTDTFHARYPPHGRRTIVTEEGVQWDRIRAPPIDTPPHDLHISDCLSDLRPGNHIEIQWRRSKEFPYGWWYGVVGHLESCDGNEHNCLCHTSDTVVLEFNQYAPGSRWRRTVVDRNDHWEEGNETDGFYGGIRKLHSNEEIAVWKRLWPAEALE